MKKLLVAAIGAAAAIGAFADYTSHPTRFEGMERGSTTIDALNTQAGGSYWAEYNDNTKSNNYSIVELEGVLPNERPQSGDDEAFVASPTNALNVATQFGKPLEFKADATGSVTIPGNLYFDSMVKFTVCEDAPTEDVCTNAYKDAKIVMWLQCDENAVTPETNLWVMAGYLSYEGSALKVVSQKYKCANTINSAFADAWHRVTIKAIGDITNGSGVPGFAIYIDGQKKDNPQVDNCQKVYSTAAKWDSSFKGQYSLTESAEVLAENGELFPSLIQDSSRGDNSTITATGFDGTGWVNDLAFTTVAPFEDAEDGHTRKATVNGAPFTDLAEAMYCVNTNGAATVELKLSASLALTKPMVFTTENTVVLDFAGVVLTNTLAGAAITNVAANLVITNSSATVGGIWCDDEANDSAFYAASGVATIEAGFFHGLVGAATSNNLDIVQGYFTQDYAALKAYLPEDKELAAAEELPGFNKVVDKQIVTHTITFEANGGTLTGDSTQVINDNDPVVKPSNPTRTDYTFVGWFWDDDDDPGTPMVEFYFSDAQDPVLPEDDLTLYAQWEAQVQYVAQIEGGAKYASLAAAVAEAQAGDTVTTLADCTISTSLSIAKNITVHNDHTITGAVNYAICIGATVTFEGSGKIERASGITGSAFCVGANETTRGAITAGTAGELIFNSGTVCGGSGGNQIKLENGTVTMNGGVLKDGKRGIKADADAGSYTSAIVINDGIITNCEIAVMASAESATGTATLTVNGGDFFGNFESSVSNGTATITINGGNITGTLTKKTATAGTGTATLTIPGTSTAKFNADRSAFCAEGYETVLKDGWYEVQKKSEPTIDPADPVPAVVVPAASAAAAIDAVKLDTPTGVDEAAYKALFDITAVETSSGSGQYTVTVTGIKEAVEAAVEESAMAVLAEEDAAKVAVPAGLYYKVTTYETLGGSAVETKGGQSTGSGVEVNKPGTTQGFIKIEMSPKAIN